MIRNRKFNSKLSVLFTSIYLFAFLFSANFHHHNGGYFYKDFYFKNSSSKISKKSTINNNDDCLSCHFASAPILLPETTDFSISNSRFKDSILETICTEKNVSTQFNFFLRGPPSFI
ncbi:hypothetical protein [Halpernia sp.]|uniref:hypothetical protein n=1 Tax=Halpernia sp. TaxID=2782209 RepID=UPI003A8F593B